MTKRNIEVLHGGENEEITKINTPQAKEGQASLHLGHVGEFHYVSLREIQDGDQGMISLLVTSSFNFEDVLMCRYFHNTFIRTRYSINCLNKLRCQ